MKNEVFNIALSFLKEEFSPDEIRSLAEDFKKEDASMLSVKRYRATLEIFLNKKNIRNFTREFKVCAFNSAASYYCETRCGITPSYIIAQQTISLNRELIANATEKHEGSIFPTSVVENFKIILKMQARDFIWNTDAGLRLQLLYCAWFDGQEIDPDAYDTPFVSFLRTAPFQYPFLIYSIIPFLIHTYLFFFIFACRLRFGGGAEMIKTASKIQSKFISRNMVIYVFLMLVVATTINMLLYNWFFR